jgi:Na+/phosphate symporter
VSSTCSAQACARVEGALLGVAAGIYVPIAMDWSADKYGLIGIAFALQSFLLVAALVVVFGAVVGATVVERIGELSLERLREHVR